MRLFRLAAVAAILAAGFGFNLSAQQQVDHCAVASVQRPTLPAVLMEGMGSAHFPITTSSPQAQKFFDQGIAQLYAFWFHEAERSFLQAALLDSGAAMAYWGIAASAAGDALPSFQLPGNSGPAQPVPSPGSPEARAREAINKAMQFRAKVTPRERLYIEAGAARRNAASREPDADYIKMMRKLVVTYPDDLDAKSMLALALENGYEPRTKVPRNGTAESLALLKEVLSRNPSHVGALHYIIHAVEGSKEPEAAYESADRLPRLVPEIPHALHMPGHVFVQTGRWEDAIRVFELARTKERDYATRDAQYPVAHYVHNEIFLVHALGVQGRFKEAAKHAGELLSRPESPQELASATGSSAHREGWYALMKTLVRFEKWDAILDGKTLPRYDRPREASWYHYARGLALASSENPLRADVELAAMRKSIGDLQKVAGWVPAQLAVALTELDGYIAVKAGDRVPGLEQMRKAVQMEDGLQYNEPSSYLRPVRELLGHVLLVLGDFRPAETTYRDLLLKEPGSGRALWGLTRALVGQGKTAESENAWRQFEAAWIKADPDLVEMQKQERQNKLVERNCRGAL